MNSSKAAGLHLIIVCCHSDSDLLFVAWPKWFTRFSHYAWQYDLIFVLVQRSFHQCEMIKNSSVWNCWVLLAEVPLSLWATKQSPIVFFHFFCSLIWLFTVFPICNRLPLSIRAGFPPLLLWWKPIQEQSSQAFPKAVMWSDKSFMDKHTISHLNASLPEEFSAFLTAIFLRLIRICPIFIVFPSSQLPCMLL